MSLEEKYDPEKIIIAQKFFQAANEYAGTINGRFLLAQCAFDGIIVRGSADALLPERSPLFIRSVGDIDLRAYSVNGPHKNGVASDVQQLLLFLRNAASDAGLTLTFRAGAVFGFDREKPATNIMRTVYGRIYPKVDMDCVDAESGRTIETHLHFSGAVPDVPPLPQETFIKAEHPFFRLAEKIRTLHNTGRIKFAGELEDQKHRRALDLLDTHQSYHIALSHAESHDVVAQELQKIFAPLCSQFNRRIAFTILARHWYQGILYSDLRGFDAREGMETYLKHFMNQMESSGKLVRHADIDPATVIKTTAELTDLLRLPLSRSLLTLRDFGRNIGMLNSLKAGPG
jgi:hypothetical protein